MTSQDHEQVTPREVFSEIFRILSPESTFYSLTIVYGIGISILSLATPISVQMLINTVANTGLTISLVVLTASLFGLVLLSGLLNALRLHVMDLFQRRFYARMVSEIALKSIYALNPFFEDQRLSSLFNRYFDIIIVQKNLPNLMIGGFTIVLQTAVGLILVSLYHPLFLLFNLVLIGLVWLIWLAWGRRAIRSAIQVSHAKHTTAGWLENLAESNGFFKSERHISVALDRTESVTGKYIRAHEHHFGHHYAQTLSFLFLYALASASLLGLGGWLVIQGELSLGQLVAAELVLSVAFFGVSQLGTYLAYFYELCGAIDELSLFDKVDQEDESGKDVRLESSSLGVYRAGTRALRGSKLDFELPAGARVMGIAESHIVQRGLADLLRRYEQPVDGYLTVGGVDIQGIAPHSLRQQVIYLARPTIVEMTMREYLDLSGASSDNKRTMEVLSAVGLTEALGRLPSGMDTRLSVSGWPLSLADTMKLRLASAIIADPRVLVLNQLFDAVPDGVIRTSLDLVQDQSDTLVIYFTGRTRELGFDHFMYLGHEGQFVYDSFNALRQHLADGELPAGSAVEHDENPLPSPS